MQTSFEANQMNSPVKDKYSKGSMLNDMTTCDHTMVEQEREELTLSATSTPKFDKEPTENLELIQKKLYEAFGQQTPNNTQEVFGDFTPEQFKHKFIQGVIPKFIESEYRGKFLDFKEGEPIPKFIDHVPEAEDVPPVFLQASKLKLCEEGSESHSLALPEASNEQLDTKAIEI